LASGAWAQDTKIETGVIAYDRGEYKKALDFFNQGLADPSLVKAKNLPRAYYHRALCKRRVMAADAQAIQGEPTKEQAMALDSLLFGAYKDLKQAKATDDGKWGKKINDALADVNDAFLQAGLAALSSTYGKSVIDSGKDDLSTIVAQLNSLISTYKDEESRESTRLLNMISSSNMENSTEVAQLFNSILSGKIEAYKEITHQLNLIMSGNNEAYSKIVQLLNLIVSGKIEAYTEIVQLMDVSADIDPNSYIPFDLRGQAKLGLLDSAGAHADFSNATRLIEANTHTRPDLLIGYSYYRKALIERYQQRNVNAALATLDKGKAALEREWGKVAAKRSEMKPEDFANQEKQYADAKGDLTNFELDLLLNAPEKLQQAIDKFKVAIGNEPNNYVLHVAYAQLLEKINKSEDAAAIYEKATRIDPANQMAWFNLGAMYVNKAVALYQEANKISDNPAKAKQLQTQADDLFRQALPYLQKANEIDQCDSETLRALLQLTINLQMNDEYKKYKDMDQKCKSGQR
jgi:hypothetical protein